MSLYGFIVHIFAASNSIIDEARETAEWLRHWVLFQRTCDQFPALTRWLTAACNASSRELDALWPVWALYILAAQMESG